MKSISNTNRIRKTTKSGSTTNSKNDTTSSKARSTFGRTIIIDLNSRTIQRMPINLHNFGSFSMLPNYQELLKNNKVLTIIRHITRREIIREADIRRDQIDVKLQRNFLLFKSQLISTIPNTPNSVCNGSKENMRNPIPITDC